jgi:hypothetical protein
VFTRSGDTAAALCILALLVDPQQRVLDVNSLQVFGVDEEFKAHGGSWDTDDLTLPPPPPVHSRQAGANGIPQGASDIVLTAEVLMVQLQWN